ncbi:MAG: hypothetical protein J1E40_05955 [Oscillospiraceae bacterium]|nr:hypothetical protein [Oscillospiraceae bacterium]
MKISSRKFKKLYMEHVERSTPDMDALWEKIESELEPKPENGVTSKLVRKKISFARPVLKWAVCVAALLMIPISVRIINNSSVSKSLDSNTAQEQMKDGGSGFTNGGAYIAADMEAPKEESADNEVAFVPDSKSASDMGTIKRSVLYEELFPDSDETAVPVPKAETSGDDFFVEENVLIETDLIVTAHINKVYGKGDTVCYEITAENSETMETESFVLESATPYVMKPERNYILPLKAENGDYRLVFENAPQIELADGGGMIFHNGWKTLDAFEENPIDVIYPQNGIDDFFYDRMRFSYRSDITPLLDEWHRAKSG